MWIILNGLSLCEVAELFILRMSVTEFFVRPGRNEQTTKQVPVCYKLCIRTVLCIRGELNKF